MAIVLTLAFICAIYEKFSCVACPLELMSVILERNRSCDTAVPEQGRQPSRRLSGNYFLFFFFLPQMTCTFVSFGFWFLLHIFKTGLCRVFPVGKRKGLYLARLGV